MKDITRESRNIFASFQGYMSDKRKALLGPLFGNPQKYVMGGRGFWRSQVPKEEQDVFRKLMANSIFAICPRGVGATSFRMYEAMQYGTIPIKKIDEVYPEYFSLEGMCKNILKRV